MPRITAEHLSPRSTFERAGQSPSRQAVPPSQEGPRADPRLRGTEGRGRTGRVRQPRPAAAAQEGPRERRLRDAGRGSRHGAGVRHAAPAGHLRRDHLRVHRPAAARGRPAGARRARARRAPAARHPDPDPRRRLRQRRAGQGGARRRAGEVRQRRAAQDRPGRPGRLARAGRAALRRGRRGPPRRRALAPPLGRLRAVGRPRRRAGRDRGPARSRQRAARGDAGGPARPLHRRRADRRGRRGLRAARPLVARTPYGWPRAASPARWTPCATAARGCRTRAASSSRSRWPTRRSRAPTPAGSTAVRDPAARRRCSRRWRPSAAPSCWPRRSSRTAHAWSHARWPATPAPTR